MNQGTQSKIHHSLVQLFTHWLNDEANDDLDLPYIGENCADVMASAALAVLAGMADLEAYLDNNDLLKR